MAIIRVDPTQLRTSAGKMSQQQQEADGLAGRALGVTSGAPSYEGQFGPAVHAIGAEAAGRIKQLASLLAERSEFLVQKAAAFEAADQGFVASILGIQLPEIIAAILGSPTGQVPPAGLPKPFWLSDEAWRQLLASFASNPPRSAADVEAALLAGGLTQEQLQIFKGVHPGAIPALLSLFTERPDVSFTSELQFTLAPGNCDVTYEHFGQGSFYWTVAVVDTSLVRLLGPQPDLASTYAVSDVPITMRIALPPVHAGLRGSQTVYDMLNRNLRDVGTVSVFLHGYQSTRGVWPQEMQKWMELSSSPTIGMAFAGMGNEGHGLGDGQYPFYPRQYAFQTMETLDLLGLYGKDLNIIGHSMGGAAALDMGITIDEIGGANPPHVRYVLLAPAVGPDSVPFLTQGGTAALIQFQNLEGSFPATDEMRRYMSLMSSMQGGYGASTALMPKDLALTGNVLFGGGVVDSLLPGAPDYIRTIHAQFANEYGFNTLKATADGLTAQPYPDPAAVQNFLANNPVLVVAANQDKLVSPDVVRRVFGPSVLSVNGNHYAHLPNSVDPSAASSPAAILEAARRVLNQPFP